MNLPLTLQAIAKVYADRPSISWDEGQLTYGAFEAQVQAIAGALRRRHGLAPGDRVALAMENSPEYLPLLYGIWRAGLSAVPMNSKLHPKEIAWILADCGAGLVIASPKLADGLSAPELGDLPPIVATGTVGRVTQQYDLGSPSREENLCVLVGLLSRQHAAVARRLH